MDKSVDLQPNSKELIIFVTPEWMAKNSKSIKVAYIRKSWSTFHIAIDEAHLFTERKQFCGAFANLSRLKSEFSSPLMALTATATPAVEEEVVSLLRNPLS